MWVTGLSISARLAKNTTTIAKRRCPNGRNLVNGLKENATAAVEEAAGVEEEEIEIAKGSGTGKGSGSETARRPARGTTLAEEAAMAPPVVADARVKPSQIDTSISGVCIQQFLLYMDYYCFFLITTYQQSH